MKTPDRSRYHVAISAKCLAEAFRIAISPHILLLAFAGVLLTNMLWSLAGGMFLPSPPTADAATEPLTDPIDASRRFHDEVTAWPSGDLGFTALRTAIDWKSRPLELDERSPQSGLIDPVLGVPLRFVYPFANLVTPGCRWGEIGYFLFGGLGTIAIWSLFGGAISRYSVVRMGLEQRLSLGQVFQFAVRQWHAFFTSPTIPIAGIALIGMPFILLGLLMRSNLGIALAGFAWPLLVLASLVMGLLGLGLAFAWPLMWSAISAEDSDSFDAISRAYAYTFQRPVLYFSYAVIASVLGSLGFVAACFFVDLIVNFSIWCVEWGMGTERLGQLRSAIGNPDVWQDSPLLWIGSSLIGLLNQSIRIGASAFSFAYFWSVFAAIYLLLRFDADETEIDQVAFSESDESIFTLPELPLDDLGIAGVPAEFSKAVDESSRKAVFAEASVTIAQETRVESGSTASSRSDDSASSPTELRPVTETEFGSSP